MAIQKLIPDHLVAGRRLARENERILDAAEELVFSAGLINQEDRDRRNNLKQMARARLDNGAPRPDKKVRGEG